MHVVLLPLAAAPPCLPRSDGPLVSLVTLPLPLSPDPPEAEVAEEVRGGGAGGCALSRSEDWTSLAWPVAEQEDSDEVVESERWAGVEPSCPGLRDTGGGL